MLSATPAVAIQACMRTNRVSAQPQTSNSPQPQSFGFKAFANKVANGIEDVAGDILKAGANLHNDMADALCATTLSLKELNNHIETWNQGKTDIKFINPSTNIQTQNMGAPSFSKTSEFLYFYFHLKEYIQQQNKLGHSVPVLRTKSEGEKDNGARRAALWCWLNSKTGGNVALFNRFMKEKYGSFSAKALGQSTWKTMRSSAKSFGKKLSGLKAAAKSRLPARRTNAQTAK